MSERFRVLRGQSRIPQSERDTWPADVPWSFVEPFRERAMSNHGQTLEDLNRRGGLSPQEFWVIAHGKRWSAWREISERAAADWLITALAAHEASN